MAKVTEHDELIYLLEKASAFQVDDNLCFGSIGHDGEQWTIDFDMDTHLLIITEDELKGCNCKGNSIDVEVDGEVYNITPFFSKRIIDSIA